MTDYKGGLAKKLAEVTKALGWIEKRGTNASQGYKYAQAVDIFDAVRTELSERGIAFGFSQDEINVHYPDGGGQHITVSGTYSFIDCETGEVIAGNWTGFDADKAGKALWKAITGGLKYVFISNFLLPTGDDPENESADKPAKSEPKPAPTTGPTPPKAEKVEPAGLTPKQRGLFMASLERRGITTDGQRKAFITFATGKMSSKQMTSADLDKALAELEDEGSKAVSNALAVQ